MSYASHMQPVPETTQQQNHVLISGLPHSCTVQTEPPSFCYAMLCYAQALPLCMAATGVRPLPTYWLSCWVALLLPWSAGPCTALDCSWAGEEVMQASCLQASCLKVGCLQCPQGFLDTSVYSARASLLGAILCAHRFVHNATRTASRLTSSTCLLPCLLLPSPLLLRLLLQVVGHG